MYTQQCIGKSSRGDNLLTNGVNRNSFKRLFNLLSRCDHFNILFKHSAPLNALHTVNYRAAINMLSQVVISKLLPILNYCTLPICNMENGVKVMEYLLRFN